MIDIYYAEDDENIAQIVRRYLEEKNCKVTVLNTVLDVQKAFRNRVPAMALIDWNMPDGSGDRLCKWIRERWQELPIIFLTVRNDSKDIVTGFRNGADDYVVKPFELEVLYSRISALLRRAGNVSGQYLSCGTISIDQGSMKVFCEDQEVALSQSEYELLSILMRNKGKTVTRERLLEQIWDRNGNYVNNNTLTVTMKRLREKIESAVMSENDPQLWLQNGGYDMSKGQSRRYWLLCVVAVSLISSGSTALFLTNYYGKLQFWMMGNFCSRVIEEEPVMEQAVMKALKEYRSCENEGAGKERLQDFGYQESDFLEPVQKDILCIALVGGGIGAVLFISAFWYWHRKISARIRGLTDELEKVNTGGSGLLPKAGDTDFARLQDEIYKTVTMLKQTRDNALEAKNHFAENLSNIAHQLKTPITAISLSNQMMRIHTEREYIDQIERQLGRLTHLEEALLLLSRIDAGTLLLEVQVVDVFTLLTLAADNLQEIAKERCVLLDIPDMGEVEINADLEWTMEAVMNLMKNCMEHTPKGGSIHCSYEQNPLYVGIRIWDEGAGFEKEEIPHLFERFYRGKKGKEKGIGIGLPLAKAILEMQNGIVHAKNLPEGGACFEICVYRH